jgi:hypothetical protein
METLLTTFTAGSKKPGAQAKGKTENPGLKPLDGIGKRAEDLLMVGMASPRGLGQFIPMDSEGVRTYLNLENRWRNDPRLEFTQGEWKAVRQSDGYQADLGLFQKMRMLGARSLEDLLASQRSDLERQRVTQHYRMAEVRGDFSFDTETFTMPWDNFRRIALAMGSISSVQAGLLFPWVTLAGMENQFRVWEREDRILPIADENRDWPTRFVVAPGEAMVAIASGEIEDVEWDEPAARRTAQRAHDEAVGDAIILMALVGQEAGLDVERLIPEAKILEMGVPPPVPDFVIEFNDGYRTFDVSCEVKGTGGSYRRKGFAREQREAGHLVYLPPYIAGGARFQ